MVRRHPWRHLRRSGKDKDCQQVVDPGRGVRREVLAFRNSWTAATLGGICGEVEKIKTASRGAGGPARRYAANLAASAEKWKR
ncbi:MAG: hypothetical protein A2X45_03895 [Lentisphaerae bacterium GWF2_50_93]|nr:MAG: hypothetical protein A2X45_03895 [Lentisphaerae bacterium GWF2_50_93]